MNIMHLLTKVRSFVLLLALLVLNVFIWMQFRSGPPRLRVSILDVGQGDSILVQGPSGIQMLVDGGPDRSVLRQLPREVGFFDRYLDLVVETHPDKDHTAGLSDVLDRYRVPNFLGPGILSNTATSKHFDQSVANESGIRTFTARRGMRIHLGNGAYADVLYPDRDVSRGEANEGSIVMRVVFGTTSFMLTGDAPSDVEQRLIELGSREGKLSTTVLKAGHHGSKYSTSDEWLAALSPKVVAVSAGKENQYGHPNPETIARIKKEGAQIISTIDSGTIRFVSDGKTVMVK